MNKSEAKFKKSALKMNDALFELLDDKDFNDITVKEICEKAKVNRSTFYSHYDTTQDLLLEAKDNIIAKFFAGYGEDKKDINKLSAKESMFINDRYLTTYLKFVKENKKLFKVFMQNLSIFRFDDVMEYLLRDVFVPILKKHNISNPTTASYYAKYYLSGITAIVLDWVERDCSDEISFISKIISQCVLPQLTN